MRECGSRTVRSARRNIASAITRKRDRAHTTIGGDAFSSSVPLSFLPLQHTHTHASLRTLCVCALSLLWTRFVLSCSILASIGNTMSSEPWVEVNTKQKRLQKLQQKRKEREEARLELQRSHPPLAANASSSSSASASRVAPQSAIRTSENMFYVFEEQKKPPSAKAAARAARAAANAAAAAAAKKKAASAARAAAKPRPRAPEPFSLVCSINRSIDLMRCYLSVVSLVLINVPHHARISLCVCLSLALALAFSSLTDSCH